MFALTVEKLSRYEYKSKKDGIAKKKFERKDLKLVADEQELCVNSDAPKVYRSPIMARRKLRVMQMAAGPRSASPLRLKLASLNIIENAESTSKK